MKKILVLSGLIYLALSFSTPCYSQISVVLGVCKTSITGGESWRDPIGLQVGVIVPVYNFTDALGLRAEANLSMQGARWEEYLYSGRTSLFYINVPVVVRYKTKIGFFGEAGLQPGILLSAKEKYEGHSEDVMKYMNKFDLSIPLGAGFEFKNNIGVGIRIIPGITDITDDKDEADRNLVFALRGTYTFGAK